MYECNELTVITGFLLIFNLVLFSMITNEWPFSVFFLFGCCKQKEIVIFLLYLMVKVFLSLPAWFSFHSL